MWREMLCLQLAHQTEGPKEAVLEKPCNGKKGDGASGESKTSSCLHTLSLRVLAEHTSCKYMAWHPAALGYTELKCL